MSALAGLGLSLGKDLMGPTVTQTLAGWRMGLGRNDASVGRELLYYGNRTSTARSLDEYGQLLSGFDPLGNNRQPIRMGMAELLKRFNSWNRVQDNGSIEPPDNTWRWLKEQLRWAGISIATPSQLRADGSPIASATVSPPTPEEIEWYRLIEMSATAAPLGDVLRDYWRSKLIDPERPAVTERELRYNLARAGFRRQADRDRLLNPFFAWGAQDAQRLKWLGAIDNEEFNSLLNAAGVIRSRDNTLFNWLSMRIPDWATLQGWRLRRLWDEDIADRYGLDEGQEQSPVASFFMRGSGVNVQQPQLPGQPAGSSDWAALDYRARRTLPDFSQAAILQHRLRPAEVDREGSPVFGLPAWTEENTRDMLTLSGAPDKIADRMMGLVYEPLNIRLINHVLAPMATHPDVKAKAEEVMGHATDWIERAMLDHGFEPGLASVAAAGILAQAQDRANAELLEHQKRLRQESRAEFLAEYERGTITRDIAFQSIIDKQFSGDEAEEQLVIVDKRLAATVTEAKLKALHEAYLYGKLPAPAIGSELQAMGIRTDRAAQYLEQWQWERSEKTRMLSTGEILAALKNGLLSAPAAQSRLVNLGWNAADALVEVAQVERELTLAAAKQQQAAAAKASMNAAKEARQHEAEAKSRSQEQLRQAKASKRVSDEVARAAHEKLLATSDYYAKAHAANSAYAKAESKGDNEKMASLVAKGVADYQTYLLDQLKLIQQGPEVADVVSPLDQRVVSVPPASESGDAGAVSTGTPGKSVSPTAG